MCDGRGSAYGCRLYCCWCAQDLAANHFWESLGFVPIAFRAGSDKKRRVHIFWQRRIDRDDQSQIGNRKSQIPYWYPSQTNSGAIRADRLVFPIPPGVHWRDIRPPDVQPVALPTAEGELKALPTPDKKRKKPVAPPPKRMTPTSCRLRFGPLPAPVAPPEPAKPKSRRVEKPKVKIDPKYFKAARELRDRYLERYNDGNALPTGNGKYEVSRALTNAAPAPAAAPALPAPDSTSSPRADSTSPPRAIAA